MHNKLQNINLPIIHINKQRVKALIKNLLSPNIYNLKSKIINLHKKINPYNILNKKIKNNAILLINLIIHSLKSKNSPSWN